MKVPEPYSPSPSTATLDVKAGGPVHAASSGPKAAKEMFPVGLTPPASVAVSEIGPPTSTESDAWVGSVGLALSACRGIPSVPTTLRSGAWTALLATNDGWTRSSALVPASYGLPEPAATGSECLVTPAVPSTMTRSAAVAEPSAAGVMPTTSASAANRSRPRIGLRCAVMTATQSGTTPWPGRSSGALVGRTRLAHAQPSTSATGPGGARPCSAVCSHLPQTLSR